MGFVGRQGTKGRLRETPGTVHRTDSGTTSRVHVPVHPSYRRTVSFTEGGWGTGSEELREMDLSVAMDCDGTSSISLSSSDREERLYLGIHGNSFHPSSYGPF